MTEYKACSRCKQILPYEAFNKDKSAIDGLQSRCRECEREVRRDYYLRNKDKEVARVSKWHKTTEKGKLNRAKQSKGRKQKYKPKPYVPVSQQDDKTKARLKAKRSKSQIKRRANFRNAEKNFISNKEIDALISKSCIYCGVNNRITIDHIIPLSRGGRHSIGNLAPACHACNSRKHARFIMEWRLNKPRADSLRRADPRSL